MKNKLVLCLATAGLALASAKSYSVNLYDSVMAGKTELRAGQYRVEVMDQKAVITNGKTRAEAPVTVGNAEKKFTTTQVLISKDGPKPRIREIDLGGTTTKLMFAE
jgi:hypothetical protein